MDEISYAFLGYLGFLLIALWWFRRNTKTKRDELAKPVQANEVSKRKQNEKLTEGVDYVDESGVIDLNRDEILHSDFFRILLNKVPNLDKDIEQSKLFYDIVKRLQPYSMTDLYKIVQYLRDNPNESLDAHRAYKSHVTASAIVYDFIIPKSLFNDDTVVLSYVAAHARLHVPVCIFDEVQNYIRQDHPEKTGEELVEEHKQVERLSNDLKFANVFLSMVFDYESFLSIEYLYGRWLDQPAVNAFNVPMYKKDINSFKKLLTMYFGSMEIDVPKDYIYIDTAVSEYILQIRRYDPKVNKIKVVE